MQFNAEACPPLSVLGHAKATTPLLDQPLQGPVYFRSNGGERELPDIVADLHGTFDIVLVGFVDSVQGRIRVRFQSVPDAPVSRFEVVMQGGKKGLLVNSVNLCKKVHRANARFVAHNGRQVILRPVVGNDCKKSKRGKHS